MYRFAKAARRNTISGRVSFTCIFAICFSVLGIAFFTPLVLFLVVNGTPAIQKEGVNLFLKAQWYYRASTFGAASMIYGTCVVALVAVAIAVPLGIGSAIMTAEYLRGYSRLISKTLIELLAGIPSVVYGLLGVLFLRPFVFRAFRSFSPETGDNLLTAGLLVGLMIIPTVTSLSDDALRSVPRSDRESSLALGLTRSETLIHAVLPKAFPGLISAVLLGLGRALGETIAVYLVVGRADNRLPHPWYSLRPLFEAGQTLTSKLGGSEVYIAYGHPLHWSAIIALSLILFTIVMACVAIGQGLLLFGRRYKD